MAAYTKDQWRVEYEDWKQDFIRKHGGDPDEEKKYLAFFALVADSKDLTDLVKRIDEFDPYYYKIILIYGQSASYHGVKIRVQFEKGKPIYIVPKDSLAYMPIPRSMMGKVLYSWRQFKHLP